MFLISSSSARGSYLPHKTELYPQYLQRVHSLFTKTTIYGEYRTFFMLRESDRSKIHPISDFSSFIAHVLSTVMEQSCAYRIYKTLAGLIEINLQWPYSLALIEDVHIWIIGNIVCMIINHFSMRGWHWKDTHCNVYHICNLQWVY